MGKKLVTFDDVTNELAGPVVDHLDATYATATALNAKVPKGELVINVKDYGAAGNGATNDSTAISNAATAATSAGGGTVFFPPGTYIASGLLIKNGVTFRGSGKSLTTIKPPTSDTNAFVFGMPAGSITNAFIEDLRVLANGNSGQRGIWMKGRTVAGENSGWCWGGLRHVTVQNFSSDNIWLQGSIIGGDCPHQFIIFEDVISFPSSATGAALRLSGKIGQLTVIGGMFDGPGQTAGTTNTTNVWITREVDDSLTEVNTNGGYAITFVNATFQSNKEGVYIDKARSVSFRDCWFENLDRSIRASGAKNVTVDGCSFSNAGKAANADGSGFIVSSTNSSRMLVRGSVISDNVDKHFVSDGGMILDGNYYEDFTGVTQTISTGVTGGYSISGANTLTVRGNSTAQVSTSSTPLRTIVSTHGPGEVLHLRPTGGPITLESGGNIGLVGLGSPFVVQAGWTVSLLKMDLGADWIVFATSAPSVYHTVKAVSGTQTMGANASLWSNTGAAATWTLPALSTNLGREYTIKNRGTGDLTIQRAGSDNLYTTSAVTSITIAAGASARVINDGAYWVVL